MTAHLRRIGTDPDVVRVSFVKVAEYQRRAIVHYHSLIRLDPTDDDDSTTGKSGSAVSAMELATIVRQAAERVHLPVAVSGPAGTSSPESADRILRFGTQIDIQPLAGADDSGKLGLARRVAAYLAKYTTKSVAEFGIAARRISAAAIGELDISAHIRRILSTVAKLATLPGHTAMLGWLHTLGYRGHITTKSRRYSVTMTALRAARHRWRIHRADQPERDDCQDNPRDQRDWSSSVSELSDWRIDGAGHRNDGERLLVHTAALRAREYRYLARLDASQNNGASP